jgi:hypothetical protein
VKAKDVKVVFTTHSVAVKIVGFDSEILTPPLGNIFNPQGERLQNPVRPDECTWSLTNEGANKYLVITLGKASSTNWSHLLSL